MQGRYSHRQHWRVFYTLSRAEKKCEQRLLERNIEVFLPVYSELRRWSDRKKMVTEPLFRNYIFAYVDEAGRRSVLKTEGIVRCVAFGGWIAEVSEKEIEQLKITQRNPQLLAPTEYSRPVLGKIVEVMEGVLFGLQGEVVEHVGSTHVVVRINSVRQAVRVRIPGDRVRELQRAMQPPVVLPLVKGVGYVRHGIGAPQMEG